MGTDDKSSPTSSRGVGNETHPPKLTSGRNRLQPSSGGDGPFGEIDGATLGIIIGCSAGAILLIIIAAVVSHVYRRRRKLFDLSLEEFSDDSFTSKSAPTSRSSSPHMPKRMSCPEAYSIVGSQSKRHGTMIRSLTADGIPNFTLPPERIQPRGPRERGDSESGFGTSFQFQQNFLGSVQPDLYRHPSFSEDEENHLPPCTHGRLWFSLVYDAAVEQLSVTLNKVKDIPGRGKTKLARDPFVKLFLLPDERTCRISKVRKKTLCPIFNETFTFQVPPGEVYRRILRFSVYDVDKRRVRHSLGHVMIPLKDADLTKGEVMWSDLEPMAQAAASLGEILFSLAYIPNTEKIKVVIMKVRNLRQLDYGGDASMHVRVQLFHGRKTHKTKKTVTQPSSPESDFNESFSFSIGGRQLDSCSVVISVMTSCTGGRFSHDEEYGKVVVGPFMFARAEELMHWQEMLAQPRTPISRWHTLTCAVPTNGD